MTPIYLHEWSSFEEMCRDFDGTRWGSYKEDPAPAHEHPRFQGVEVLLASYGTGNYEGDAFVLFRRDGKLYEVNGGHCSCYGLEGQWDPEETTIEALEHRLDKGNVGSDWCGNSYAGELRAVLATLKEAA